MKPKFSLIVPKGVAISLSSGSLSILQYGEQGMGIFITRLKRFGRFGRFGGVCALACCTILANANNMRPETAMAAMTMCLC